MAFRFALLVITVICFDDILYKFVTNDIFFAETHDTNILDVAQHTSCLNQTRDLAVRQVDLGNVCLLYTSHIYALPATEIFCKIPFYLNYGNF